jgi:hypothetical protein
MAAAQDGNAALAPILEQGQLLGQGVDTVQGGQI